MDDENDVCMRTGSVWDGVQGYTHGVLEKMYIIRLVLERSRGRESIGNKRESIWRILQI